MAPDCKFEISIKRPKLAEARAISCWRENPYKIGLSLLG
jgi:hypothetical protein